MSGGKTKKWWILAAIILALSIGIAGYFLRCLAPKLLLTSALTKTFTQLEARFQGSPLWLLADTVDQEGKYSAEVDLNTANSLLGPVNYRMAVQSDCARNCFSAKGTAQNASQELDLSIYLDRDFMAVSSEQLVKGVYYGIRYDTFAEDFRSIPLLDFIVSDRLLSKWDLSVRKIQEEVSKDRTLPDMGNLSPGIAKQIILGIAAMPFEIEEVSVLLNGLQVICKRYVFHADAQALQKLTDAVKYQGSAPKDIRAAFYLYKNSVVRMELLLDQNPVMLELGENPAVVPLTVSTNTGSVTVTTLQSESQYTENWKIQRTQGRSTEISFRWNPLENMLTLQNRSQEEAITIGFAKTESGFHLETDDLARLVRVFSESEGAGEGHAIACSMNVQRGSDITVPEYKRMNQWTMEDFFALLGGVGSLLGITIE